MHRLRPGDVALIAHSDLDELAAQELAARRVVAVLDTEDAATGRIPNRGPAVLVGAGIALVDRLGGEVWNQVSEGQPVRVLHGRVIRGRSVLAHGRRLTPDELVRIEARARQDLPSTVADFARNTLLRASEELDLLSWECPLAGRGMVPEGRPCVVVARGPGYRKDFAWIARRLGGAAGVGLIAVDGAADLSLEAGWRPDVIVGDMDSVSDQALRAGSMLVAHANPEGDCPGSERLRSLALPHEVMACRGTSVDAALLLAEAQGADPVIGVGMARGPLDFLEKGRFGMASTMLVRFRLGDRLIDSRGFRALDDLVRRAP
jgi:uncharacterized membrane-anchored protein